jgi:hypothetical protein
LVFTFAFVSSHINGWYGCKSRMMHPREKTAQTILRGDGWILPARAGENHLGREQRTPLRDHPHPRLQPERRASLGKFLNQKNKYISLTSSGLPRSLRP